MSWFEETYVLTDACNWKPKFWKRIEDDIFCVWQHGEDQIEPFLQYLNSCEERISFTKEIEGEKGEPGLSFMDMHCRRSGENIITKVYRKPSNTNRYLNFRSNGPLQTKIGIMEGFFYGEPPIL